MGHCDQVFASKEDRFYHDHEGGIPNHNDDRLMFEQLTLESLQCGLSWGIIMKKRDIFRRCFENFEYDKIADFDDDDVQRILNTEGMLRSERKIRAVINNARCYRKIRVEFGSFCDYLWAYTNGKTVLYDGHADGAIPVSNGLSDKISKDMKKRGFKFIGSVTIYSLLQACGVINDHAGDCPCYKSINKRYPTIKLKPDKEIGQAGGKAQKGE